MQHDRRHVKRSCGFTIIELLVVLAALALLLSVAAPRYMQHLDRAKEVALKENLFQTRQAIDKFYSDQGRYPVSLQELVLRRYLRALPLDPVTEREDSWVIVPPQGQVATGLADIHSGSRDLAQDGKPYASW